MMKYQKEKYAEYLNKKVAIFDEAHRIEDQIIQFVGIDIFERNLNECKIDVENYDLQDVIYMGDGIFDHYVFEKVGYSIAPANADKNARESANYVTERLGGDRAVAEACLHILEKFFEPYDPKKLPSSGDSLSGQWSV